MGVRREPRGGDEDEPWGEAVVLGSVRRRFVGLLSICCAFCELFAMSPRYLQSIYSFRSICIVVYTAT